MPGRLILGILSRLSFIAEMFSFDGLNRIISCDTGVTAFSVATLYSEWKRWLVSAPENAKWVPAFDLSVGGDDLGGGVSLGAYYFLLNEWKIRPQDADHTLTIEGNLFPRPSTNGLFVTTLNPRIVIITMRNSSLTQQVGGSITNASVAQAVWDHDLANDDNAAGSSGDVLKKTKSSAQAAVALSA